jgi:hypothetical protein
MKNRTPNETLEDSCKSMRSVMGWLEIIDREHIIEQADSHTIQRFKVQGDRLLAMLMSFYKCKSENLKIS